MFAAQQKRKNLTMTNNNLNNLCSLFQEFMNKLMRRLIEIKMTYLKCTVIELTQL